MTDECHAGRGRAGPAEVGRAFLALGCTCFGGPIAHVGYFREAFVARRRWLGEARFAELVALMNLLPGPTSSQLGFALGVERRGVAGGLLAWLGFTLPSFVLMVLFGAFAARGAVPAGLVHGLKLVVVAVVAQALLGMARSLCPDVPRKALAAAGAACVLMLGGVLGQFLAIGLGAAAGIAAGWGREAGGPTAAPPAPLPRGTGVACLTAFALLLGGLPALAAASGDAVLGMIDAFFRAGALVFGGGHVVLPLLREAVVPAGWIDPERFLAGYGAAQALPGPLFAFAAYLGYVMDTPVQGLAGAVLATVAIFLPALLLVLGVLPFWAALRRRKRVADAVAGVGAAVVGLLLAAWIDPILVTGVRGPWDALAASLAFLLLWSGRVPVVAVVAGCALTGLALGGA